MSLMDKNAKKNLLKLRDIRRKKGMSLNALAEKVGVDYQRVGRMERGETQISIDVLRRISQVLQVPLSLLLGEEDIVELQNTISQENNKGSVTHLVPLMYEKMDSFCKKHTLEVEGSVKVHLATVMFKAIQDIRINVQDDEEMVKVLFQLFDAIFERLVWIAPQKDDE